ncbi:MAG TPA: ABC transporter permease subunit [Xanthobacteraceae bacterium]|nr:ABC transporter permease subunit [Xanthobacteraceae bacterium]
MQGKRNPGGRFLVVLVPYLWLAFFFLVPFLIVLKISLSHDVMARPPYAPLLDLTQGWQGIKEFLSQLDFSNYALLGKDRIYLAAYLQSLRIAAISTVLLLLIGYPIAYAMARAPERLRPLLVMAVILPFWTSFLIRIYAWIGILSREGFLSQLLIYLGLTDRPVELLYTNTAVYIGIVYSYLPLMVLPLYATLEKMDHALLEAAADLGAPPLAAFWRVTFPLSLPGVIAGSLLCFIPAVGEFVIPDLMGGSETLMIGKTMWTEFFENRSWTVSSAVAVVLLIVLVAPILIYQRAEARSLEKAA